MCSGQSGTVVGDPKKERLELYTYMPSSLGYTHLSGNEAMHSQGQLGGSDSGGLLAMQKSFHYATVGFLKQSYRTK